MATEEKEKKIKQETKQVSVQESEKLQKEGWVVVSMSKRDGKKVHTLVKGE